MPSRPDAFTLVEMLIVIAILATLAGIILVSLRRDERSASVLSAAQELAGVLTRTRSMAMRDRITYGVAFNIQNEPGSTGEMLNNRSGGHWYRVIGPAQNKSRGYEFTDLIPSSGDTSNESFGNGPRFPNFPNLLDAIASSWVSEAHTLPPRKVRFLALSDVDEGPRRSGNSPISPGTTWYGSAGESTYPRPFFGYFDEATKQLWPWGGYNDGKPYSGFYYQGDAPAWIADSRNPAPTRTWQYYPERAKNLSSLTWLDYDVLPAGKPRALVNAAWLDACLVFLPDGRAMFQEWNRNRRYYSASAVSTTTLNDQCKAGVKDMCKSPLTTTISSSGIAYWDDADQYESFLDGNCPYDWPEVTHFTEHTGGWFITLAPDLLSDQRTFNTAREALASMLPMVRVWIGVYGAVQVVPVHHREAEFSGRTLWPATPDMWLATTPSASNPVWRRCRMGSLHSDEGGDPPQQTGFLRPAGKPITDIVNTSMLTRRQWWIDEP